MMLRRGVQKRQNRKNQKVNAPSCPTVRPDAPYTVHSPSRILDRPRHSRLVRLYSPQPILRFRVVLLRMALAGLKETIDLAALVSRVSVIGGTSSLEAIVGWLLENHIDDLAFLEFFSACY